jgi:hypothetical protein
LMDTPNSKTKQNKKRLRHVTKVFLHT